MFSIIDPKPKDSLGEQFRKLWRRLKTSRPLAYFLVLVIAAGKLPIPYIQTAALSALGCIIMSNLYTLVDSSTTIRRRRTFKNISEAQGPILEYVKECYKRDGYVEIKWLGMTMFNVWNTLTFVLNDLRDEGSVNSLHLKVAMLDPAWLGDNSVNPAWTPQRAVATEINIFTYFNSALVKALKWDFEVSQYSHMPGLHGGIINDKYLFLGVCQWKSDRLEAGECPYYLYTFKEVDDLEKISIFNGWFKYCATGKVHAVEPSLIKV